MGSSAVGNIHLTRCTSSFIYTHFYNDIELFNEICLLTALAKLARIFTNIVYDQYHNDIIIFYLYACSAVLRMLIRLNLWIYIFCHVTRKYTRRQCLRSSGCVVGWVYLMYLIFSEVLTSNLPKGGGGGAFSLYAMVQRRFIVSFRRSVTGSVCNAITHVAFPFHTGDLFPWYLNYINSFWSNAAILQNKSGSTLPQWPNGTKVLP